MSEKILYRKIDNCHKCPRLWRTNIDECGYKTSPLFKYECKEHWFRNRETMSALTTKELFDNCPLPDETEFKNYETWAFNDIEKHKEYLDNRPMEDL